MAFEKPPPPPYSASGSHSVQAIQQQTVPICCISLHERDKIRLINVPQSLLPAFRTVLQSSWPYGIQSESTYSAAYQFKMSGNPWLGQGTEAVYSRRLATGIMRFMLQNGWILAVRTDISKKPFDKDTWYFRHQTPDPHAMMCAISFNRSDLLRVIDGPEEVVGMVRHTIEKGGWKRGLQRFDLYNGCPEFKMYGNPWWADGGETVATRIFLMHLVANLESIGWVVYASVDISTGHEGRDLDSWILRKVR